MVTAPRPIPDSVRTTQARASDPTASAFVSANAGSGKTHVLVQRVIRLLLNDVPPEKILCITFTKAAAANMAERVFSTLGHWVTLDDAALDAAIAAVGIAQPRALRNRARELFACALETPGGLKVQTIHALCTRLLQLFPFEANVPARFSVIDERDQNDMMERANLAVLLAAAREPDSRLGRALATAMAAAADATFKEVVREACLSREHFIAWTSAAGSPEAAAAQLSSALGIGEADRIEDVERAILDGPNLPRASWKKIAGLLDTGSKSDTDQAARLRDALQAPAAEQVDAYLEVFLTDDRKPRKSLLTAGFRGKNPPIERLFDQESLRLDALIERRRALTTRDRTEALLHIATAAAENYRREKQERGLLDYDDLIDRTLALLDKVSAGWVHYKLDRGIDHVLIDEAQDTSPRQWDIVAHLIAEFSSGAGARDGLVRTIFAVGDEKQSIFSFQGAAPREFDARRRALRRKFEDAGLKFDPVSFNTSFRSGAAILHAVDHVFRDQAIYRSIHAVEAYPIHDALSDAGPSLIDLWELQLPDDRPDLEGWRAPFDAVSETSPEVRMARRIQAEIRALVEGGTMTGPIGRRRRVSYGDMLVLVRRRGNAFDAVIQALKHANIPVAGADRLKLTEHIAIIDLMNLADALLLPGDDLALAVALKSPLFGLNDDDLFKLAWQRRGTLREALRQAAADEAAADEAAADAAAAGDARFAAAHERLERYQRRLARETPFAFYAWLLGGDGGRQRILRRLGPEANDALDEFLELALNHERKAPASLQGFMAWLRSADTEVKRDMEISRDEVRVMTVHGAKGLESAVVFLVDTTAAPADSLRLRLIPLPGGAVVWAGRKADDPAMVATARQAMLEETEDEYRRLLYVAMTRAADRLVVAGCMPGNRAQVRALSWYDLIGKGLEGSGLPPQTVATAQGPVRRYQRPNDIEAAPAIAAAAVPRPQPIDLPDWLQPPPAPERFPVIGNHHGNVIASEAKQSTSHRAQSSGLLRYARNDVVGPGDAMQVGSAPAGGRLRPSGAAVPPPGRGQPQGEPERLRARALQRGTLVHRLLQSLPEIAAERRRAAALNYLARQAKEYSVKELSVKEFSEAERETLVQAVLNLIADDRFKALFGPGSRAEVAIAGRLRRPGRPPLKVSGQIDRLVVTPAEILIVDFKTNQARPEQAPAAYLRQLALYRAVLQQIYPERPVRAALLWTEALEWMEISAPALDAELAALEAASAMA